MAKELRITFKEKEEDLYNYIQSKSSASAFLKDLANLEKKKEEIILMNLKNDESLIDTNKNTENKIEKKDIIDLDISDLE